MSNFQHCIVTLIDMIGIRSLLNRGDTAAVAIMKRMHSEIPKNSEGFTHDTEICYWNDAVLIHSLVDDSESSVVSAVRPIVPLKAAIDAIRPSYAISVKGQSFPPQKPQTNSSAARLVYLSASSLAFTNCFDIEAELKTNLKFKRRRYAWYIDDRIIRKTKRTLSRPANDKHRFKVYPKASERFFHMFDGSFTRDTIS